MSGNRTVAVLVARQGSKRLPGKGMLEICGRPVVWHILNRLQKMDLFDEICLATSNLPQDRALVDLAESVGARAYAGHPDDVLERLYEAAKSCDARVVVEVGGDCPFVDPAVTRRALTLLEEEDADYVTNVDPATFPDGIDIHVVRMEALEFAARNAVLTSQRLHPLSYFHRHRRRFKVLNFTSPVDLSGLRWTLDYEEDFRLIARVFQELYPTHDLFTMDDVLALLERQPELSEINRKWAAAPSGGTAPAYWFNSSYTSDMLNDVALLTELCSNLEKEREYERAAVLYAELEGIAEELRVRAEHFDHSQRPAS